MTATPPPDPYREWDAAYVLGALGPTDRRAFEQHLAACGACRTSVAELAGMPGLLGMLTPEHATALDDHDAPGADASAADVVPLATLAAGARHRRARRRGLLVAAAVALVVVGGATGVVLSGDGSTVPADGPGGPGTPTLVAAGTTVELLPVGGADVRAELVLTPAAWGTRLDWSCSYPTGVGASGATYELVLVDEAGAREVVATWSATDAGRSDGLGASSAVPLDGIARLELGVTGLDEPLAAADVRTTT